MAVMVETAGSEAKCLSCKQRVRPGVYGAKETTEIQRLIKGEYLTVIVIINLSSLLSMLQKSSSRSKLSDWSLHPNMNL